MRTEATIKEWKPKALMARLIGSRSTSTPVWNPYKMASDDPSHPFSVPTKHRCHSAVSLRPDPIRLVAEEEETSPPSPGEEPKLEVHYKDPVTSPNLLVPASLPLAHARLHRRP
jgi:hypothetical protein